MVPSRAALALLILLWPGLLSGRAETIKLRNGQTVEGKILKQEKGSILVDIGVGTPVTYFRDEIKEIIAEGAAAADPAARAQISAQADELEARAVDLIDGQQMPQGLDLLRQALALDPTAQRHMNYGSILFGNGVEAFKQGKTGEGRKVLRDAEEELNKAIEGFSNVKDAAPNAMAVAQAYFLLGEMYANAFGDPAQARAYYQKAVDLAGHEGAKAALSKSGQNS